MSANDPKRADLHCCRRYFEFAPNLIGVTMLGAQLGLQAVPRDTSDMRVVRIALANLLAISVARSRSRRGRRFDDYFPNLNSTTIAIMRAMQAQNQTGGLL